MEKTTRKYGFGTGIVVVITTVIGTGIFIKGSEVLKLCNGSLPYSLFAWLISGLIMVAGGFCFAVYATRVEKFNGCIDYIEHASNRTVGYYFGYFLAMVYFPITVAQTSFVAGKYLVSCFTNNQDLIQFGSWPVLIVALSLVTIFFLINYYAPKISHHFQVSILFVKLFPLILLIVIGLFAKLINPNYGIINAFINPASGTEVVDKFGDAIKTTSYAYDGWICVAAFNAQMKNSKKNLPRAIVVGTIAVLIIYLLYFVGLSSFIGNQAIVDSKDLAIVVAFYQLMGDGGAIFFLALIFLSCTGNVNVMTMTAANTTFALGFRGEGFMPKKISRVKDGNIGFPAYLFTFFLVLFYVVLWALTYNKISIFSYLQDMDTIVCSIVYGAYIWVYIYMMRHFKNENKIIRFVMPVIAILGSLFMVFCGTGLYGVAIDHDVESLKRFGVFLALMVIIYIPGIIVYNKNHQKIAPKNI